jgi:hypothetical protein
MRVHPPVKAQKPLLLSNTDPCHQSFNFEAQSGDYLPPCNFRGVFAKNKNFEPKVGHCTTANETLNIQKPEII